MPLSNRARSRSEGSVSDSRANKDASEGTSAGSASTSVLVPSSRPTRTSKLTRFVGIPFSLLRTPADDAIASPQVAVPTRVAVKLTYPDRVTHQNIEILRGAVRNGHDVHPGANFILQGGDERFKKFLKFGDRVRLLTFSVL